MATKAAYPPIGRLADQPTIMPSTAKVSSLPTQLTYTYAPVIPVAQASAATRSRVKRFFTNVSRSLGGS